MRARNNHKDIRPLFKSFRLTALAATALAAACGNPGSGTPTGKTPITRDFAVVSQGWERQDSVTRYIYAARDRGGVTEICGAIYSEGTGIVKSLEPRLLNSGGLESDGTLVVNSISFFNRLRSFDNGSMANCVVTAIPWEQRWAANPPQLRFRSLKFEI